jgi:type I restriction enzyme S subunit
LGAEHWKPAVLQDLVFLQRGFDITKAQQQDGDIPVFSSSGLSSWHNKAMAQGPGVIIGRKGTLGSVHYAKGDYWPHDTTLWSKSLNGNNPRFVYYALMCLGLERFNIGGPNPTLNRNHIHNLPIRLAERHVQNQIVTILSTYDDLIENNRRRIRLLEEAAWRLYHEWFVRFRFPGYEHVNIIDGIPEGWERRTLTDVAEDVSYGFTATADYDIEGPKFLRITDIVDGPIDWGTVPRCMISEARLRAFLLATGDIVVARAGDTTGWARRIGRYSEPAVFASYLVRFRFGETYNPEMAAAYMQSDYYRAFVKSNLCGVAQSNATAKVLGSAIVPVPHRLLQTHYAASVRAMFDQTDVLMEQIRKLAEARNLLLSRLMNGSISVEGRRKGKMEWLPEVINSEDGVTTRSVQDGSLSDQFT